MDESLIFIHVNCRDKEEAEGLASFLLEANLISCANILPPHTAIYVWEAKLCNEPEVAMLLKTMEKNYKEIERVITQKHSYDCPSLCYWRIDGGYSSYLAWVKNSTI